MTFPRRFFRSAAKPIAAAWQLAAGGDLALPEVEGPRPLSVRIANAYMDRVLTACESDAMFAGQFFKVNALVDPPRRLLHPAFIRRVATVNLRRRKEDWASQLPQGVVGELTDQAALDRWAADETGGLIDHSPLDITAGTQLMIASALAARVRWRTPFDGYPRGGGSALDEPGQQRLRRTTSDLAAAAVLDAAVTRIVVDGDGDLDVHLLLGDQRPADVLAAGLRELSGEARVRLAADLDNGAGAPGLTVRLERSSNPEDELLLKLASFEIRPRHDLLTFKDMLGLRSVTDSDESHLPLLSPLPLYVSRGAQDVLARFFAEGFEAAAVTAFDVECTGAPPPER